MSQIHVAVVVGSIRKESFNRQFAEAFVKLAPADVKFSFVRIDDLPLYDQDADAVPAAPAVARLRDEVKAADAVLFVTPEYNRSFPGVLKNAIDQGSRPWGKSVWAGKPAAVMGVSIGAIGASMAQQHLHNVLAYLAMPTLPGNEAFIHWKDGLVVDGEVGPQSKEFAQGLMNAFVDWVKKFVPAK